MPSYFNDEVVISAIKTIGIPAERARDYGIVGCYEANPQGDTHGLTVAGNFSLPELLLQYLQSCQNYDSFVAFYDGFKKLLQTEYIKYILPRFQEIWDNIAQSDPSPFLGICLTGCLESGLTAEEGGARYSLFGVNILGLGTTIDSLHVIRELVYTKRTFNMDYIREQLNADFEDQSFYLLCRSMHGKYGSDSEFINKLVGDFSEFVALLVLMNKLMNGVRPYPGFFSFLQDIRKYVTATPDGRRSGERLSYGCGPTEYSPEKTLTSILNSAINVRHDLCACGNPLTLSLGKSELAKEESLQILKQLIQVYFNGGGFHLHFNIVNAETLEDAQQNPGNHDGLLVRISGFSAKFVNLDKQVQDAIITRTKLEQ